MSNQVLFRDGERRRKFRGIPLDLQRAATRGRVFFNSDGQLIHRLLERGFGEVDAREVLETAELDPAEGLVGDSWRLRASSRTPDGAPHPDIQLTLMSSRVISLLAGDQLYVDLDLSAGNLAPGTRLALGTAVVEITVQPHTGCKKFVARFGADALRLVSSPTGRRSNLRGIYAKVVQAGAIRAGDRITRLGGSRAPGATTGADPTPE